MRQCEYSAALGLEDMLTHLGLNNSWVAAAAVEREVHLDLVEATGSKAEAYLSDEICSSAHTKK